MSVHPQSESAQRSVEAEAVAVEQTNPTTARWNELTAGLTSIHGRPFDAEREYSQGDVVLHKQHGMGVVEAVEEDASQMTVLFRSGEEVLTLEPHIH